VSPSTPRPTNNQLTASVQGSTATYYLTDGLGSTTERANGGGTVSDTYRYDAFGAVRSSSGASTQPFRYTGEQWDSESALEATTPVERPGSTSWPAGRRRGRG